MLALVIGINYGGSALLELKNAENDAVAKSDVRNAVSVALMPPRTPGQVYGCLGCSAQCGRCARTIKKIMDEALGACAKSCCSGCPHSQAHAEPDVHAEFALAAS